MKGADDNVCLEAKLQEPRMGDNKEGGGMTGVRRWILTDGEEIGGKLKEREVKE